ncbi:MAG TPA: HAD family phosphatase [Nitrospiraceae bacterium]|jgi:beta-phosphoglucomutase-like phosphatase (HAD superfamily)
MIRAIIFDFNGVIADDETPHLLCFQQALDEHGLSITKEEYYGTFLGMDERTCTATLLSARDGHCDNRILATIINRKAEIFRQHTDVHRPLLFPGVVELVKHAGAKYRLAIASGGRREQIDDALRDTPIDGAFSVIIAAEDCLVGKPDPAIYFLTLKKLNGKEPRPPLLKADECLVVEDSLAGIRSAKAAGMGVVAIASTYPIENLQEADFVLPTLSWMSLQHILDDDMAGRQL